jgi:hypothetical protein
VPVPVHCKQLNLINGIIVQLYITDWVLMFFISLCSTCFGNHFLPSSGASLHTGLYVLTVCKHNVYFSC